MTRYIWFLRALIEILKVSSFDSWYLRARVSSRITMSLLACINNHPFYTDVVHSSSPISLIHPQHPHICPVLPPHIMSIPHQKKARPVIVNRVSIETALRVPSPVNCAGALVVGLAV
jgi:hypothetical protein